jgi:hypothetical protein
VACPLWASSSVCATVGGDTDFAGVVQVTRTARRGRWACSDRVRRTSCEYAAHARAENKSIGVRVLLIGGVRFDSRWVCRSVKREKRRTGFGDKVDDTVPDTDRRGTRLCGNRRRDTGEGADADSELCVILPELDAPELLPEAEDEDRVVIPPWKCNWRCTGA